MSDPTKPALSRAERRQQREARRARRQAPPPVQFPASTDPLLVYDRHGEPAGHVLRDLWRPAAAFLVGGGPSLNRLPYELLAERGIVSLGINNVCGKVPVRAFVCSDPPEKFHHGIFFDPAMLKFVPQPKLRKRVRAKLPDGSFCWTTFRVGDCPNVWGFSRRAEFDPAQFLTTQYATWGNDDEAVAKNGRPKILFTFFLALRLLHYLGVRRIYLLGVDFTMHDGPGGGYAFEQSRWASSVGGNQSIYRVAAAMCAELRPVFDRSGLEVYNCNQESGLAVWPYVPFTEALEDCRGMTPREPYDLSGWYEKDGKDEEERGEKENT
jgi:hypothetical protein